MGSISTILQANNITRIKRAEYDAAVMTQKASNKLEAAKQSLSDFSRSLANVNRMEAAGKEYNEAVNSVVQTLESRSTDRINSSLAAADKLGALAAGAAFQGVGGSSVELLDSTVRLQRNVEQQLQDTSTSRIASAGARSAAQVIDNAASQTDLSRTFGNFNYTRYIEPKAMKRRLGKLIGVAVATAFGGPQAGEAVADFAVGKWQADNADFEGMSKSFGSAARNASSAAQDWMERGGESWFGSVTNKKDAQAAKAETSTQAINWGSFEPGQGYGFGSGFGEDWFR